MYRKRRVCRFVRLVGFSCRMLVRFRIRDTRELGRVGIVMMSL